MDTKTYLKLNGIAEYLIGVAEMTEESVSIVLSGAAKRLLDAINEPGELPYSLRD